MQPACLFRRGRRRRVSEDVAPRCDSAGAVGSAEVRQRWCTCGASWVPKGSSSREDDRLLPLRLRWREPASSFDSFRKPSRRATTWPSRKGATVLSLSEGKGSAASSPPGSLPAVPFRPCSRGPTDTYCDDEKSHRWCDFCRGPTTSSSSGGPGALGAEYQTQLPGKMLLQACKRR